MPFIKELLPIAVEALVTAALVWIGIGLVYFIVTSGATYVLI